MMKSSPFNKHLLLWLVWGGFIAYAFLLAPPDQPDTLPLIISLSSGQWEGINPLVVALFNVMGIWPMIYAALMLFDGRGQKVRAWPFVLGSFGVGAFVILPYLALRRPNPTFEGEKSWLLRILESRLTGAAIALAAFILLGYGLVYGDWPNFIQQWQSSRFIHVMSLDFLMLGLLFPILLGDDMVRRGVNRQLFWPIALLPLIGSALYLVVRSPIGATKAEQAVMGTDLGSP